MIILINSHEKVSREFKIANDVGVQFVDWADEAQAAAYLAEGNPHPSAFPSVVSDAKTIIRCPQSLDHAKELIKALESSDEINTLKGQLSLGYPVEGKDFHLSFSKDSLDSFSKLLVLLSEGINTGAIQVDDMIKVIDINGAMKEMPASELRVALVKYGMHYKNLWDQIKLLESN